MSVCMVVARSIHHGSYAGTPDALVGFQGRQALSGIMPWGCKSRDMTSFPKCIAAASHTFDIRGGMNPLAMELGGLAQN